MSELQQAEEALWRLNNDYSSLKSMHIAACTQRDELLIACKSILSTYGSADAWYGQTRDSLVLIEQAIENAEDN